MNKTGLHPACWGRTAGGSMDHPSPNIPAGKGPRSPTGPGDSRTTTAGEPRTAR